MYWYLSSPWPNYIEFTLNETGKIDPVLELEIWPAEGEDIHQAGMHNVNLADYDITLEADKEYEWFVVIVLDPEQRSGDLLSSGIIKLTTPPETLPNNLSDEQAYVAYAEHGLWYDAIHDLSTQILNNPDNKTLRLHRADLSEQAKMQKVADYDRSS